MGIYVNPGNRAFAEIADADYEDMTGLIQLINQTIDKKNKLTCVSRPRRFGKSWAASMLAAYYDCACDSHDLFDKRKIARLKGYEEHLNQYHVVYLDISGFVSAAQREGTPLELIPSQIIQALDDELRPLTPEMPENSSLESRMLQIAEESAGRRFIFIIDEWDAMIRETSGNEDAQKRYLTLLRGWFKNKNFTPRAVAAAYMTGILPIKKDGTQSTISDFREFTMLYPGKFAKYTGFTEPTVKRLCRKNRMDFEQIKAWYDGYDLAGTGPIYNPYSVMSAMEEKNCRSFWGKTSAAEGLTDYIKMDFDGLQETVASLIAGSTVEVNINGFQNDFERFKSRDDILTLLVHLGYLVYNAETGTVKIPNEEVMQEFQNFLAEENIGEHWVKLISRSRKLLQDTLEGREEAVAAALEEIRGENYAPQYYNHEQALRAIIKYAYLAAFGRYIKVEEMTSGKGIADVVFLPASLSRLPAMVIELKWNKTSGGAIEQIKQKNYTANLSLYEGNLLLVGINYDAKSGQHTCEIEKG